MTSATRCRVFHGRGGSRRCVACGCSALRDGSNSEGDNFFFFLILRMKNWVLLFLLSVVRVFFGFVGIHCWFVFCCDSWCYLVALCFGFGIGSSAFMGLRRGVCIAIECWIVLPFWLVLAFVSINPTLLCHKQCHIKFTTNWYLILYGEMPEMSSNFTLLHGPFKRRIGFVSFWLIHFFFGSRSDTVDILPMINWVQEWLAYT